MATGTADDKKSVQEILNDVYDSTESALNTTGGLTAGDIEIGAVEIKDGTADTRGSVTTRGSKGAVAVEVVDASGNQVTTFGSTNTEYVDDADWTDSTSKHNLTGGIYQSTPQTVTDGDTAPLEIDVNGNLLTSLATKIAGEDLTNDVLKTEERFSYTNITAEAQIKSGAGFLHTVTISQANLSSTVAGLMTIYDSLTETGTVIWKGWIFTNPVPVTITLDVSFATGCYVGFDGTLSNCSVTVAYR